MQLNWRAKKNQVDSTDRFYTAASPVGTFYVFNYEGKWGASLLPFNKGNGDMDIGKLRPTPTAAKLEAQKFIDKVAAKFN